MKASSFRGERVCSQLAKEPSDGPMTRPFDLEDLGWRSA